jgi:hypothetical protein
MAKGKSIHRATVIGKSISVPSGNQDSSKNTISGSGEFAMGLNVPMTRNPSVDQADQMFIAKKSKNFQSPDQRRRAMTVN